MTLPSSLTASGIQGVGTGVAGLRIGRRHWPVLLNQRSLSRKSKTANTPNEEMLSVTITEGIDPTEEKATAGRTARAEA
jgi:hypothetical protein